MNEHGDVLRWRRGEGEIVEALHLGINSTGQALRWIVSEGGDAYADHRGLVLITDEGKRHAPEGSWIVRDAEGCFTVVPNTIFHIHYDAV